MKKARFLALLLALCLACGLLAACKGNDPPPAEPPAGPPVSPQPEKPAGITEGSFTYYELEDGTWAVIAADTVIEGALSIPAIFRDKSVTQIGLQHPTERDVYYGFAGKNELTAITIPASVKTILPYAFTACKGLRTVTLAEGAQLSSIGSYALAECTALTELALPEGLTTLGDAALSACTTLQSVTLPSTLTTLGSRVFEDCHKLLYVTNLSAVTLTGLSEFAEVRTSTDTAFAATVTENNGIEILSINGKQYLFGYVGTEAVLDLTALGFTAVFPAALMGNKTVTEIKLPEALTEIGYYAFFECSSLTKLSFGESSQLTTIGDAAFEACRALSNLTLPGDLESIGYRAFVGCEALAELAIPASVTEIGDTAFAACILLAKLTFAEESHLATIGSQAFFACEKLSEVSLPASLTQIGDRAFVGCAALSAVAFGSRTGWQLTPGPEGGAPSLSNTANNAYYLTDLYANCTWSRA